MRVGIRMFSRAAVIGAALGLMLAVSGCTADPPTASPETASPTTSASPSASPTAAAVLVPDGSAEDNLPYFDTVNSTLLAGTPSPGGRAIIDNLVAAGFDKTAMQLTPDQTTIGNGVDSIQFSVLFAGECLVGQAGASGYAGTVGPVADGTSCLVGSTRVIDW